VESPSPTRGEGEKRRRLTEPVKERRQAMNPIEAVLFDLDGVVIDTRQSVTDFWLVFAAERNVTLTAADFDDHILGVPASHTLRVLFPDFPAADLPAFRQRIAAYESGLRYVEVPGATAFLRALRESAVPTALVTSGENWKVDEVFRQLSLDGLFDVIVTAQDIRRGKPDPECCVRAARRLGVAASCCVVFEDSVSGVRSAVAAGALCIGVQVGPLARRLIEGGARHIVSDFSALNLTRHQTSDGPHLLHLGGGHELFLQARRASH
jgi:sugar-phosphatase